MTVVPFSRRSLPAMELANGPGASGAVVPATTAVAWVQRARKGDVLRYATGHLPSWSATPKRLYELCQQGLVALTVDRNTSPKEYLAERTDLAWPGATPPVRRIARAIPPSADDMARLLKVLQAEARGEQPCSTNQALAIKAGLSDANRASYLMKKLVRAGAILNEAVNWWPGRQVTDLSTGARTLVKVGTPIYAKATDRAGAR